MKVTEYEVLPHFRYSPIRTHFKVLFTIHTANKDKRKKSFLSSTNAPMNDRILQYTTPHHSW